MGFGNYPPGVTGKMIDEYYDRIDPVEPPMNCGNCTYYEERTCGMICSVLEADCSETALGEMTDKEYMEKFGKQPDDYCEDHKFWED